MIIKQETEKAVLIELTISRKNCISENISLWFPKSMIENTSFINTKFSEVARNYLSKFSGGQVIKKSVLNNTTVSFAEEAEKVIISNTINHKIFGLCEVISSDDKFATLKLANNDIKKVMTKFI